MAFRYVPILRWKQGERTALSHLTAAGKANVCPLILLGAGQYGDTKPPKTSPKKPPKTAPLSASEALIKQIKDAWGSGDIFIDASDLPGTASHHHFDQITASARKGGLSIIPAMRLTSLPAFEAAATRAAAKDGRGVALRIGLAEMTSAASWAPNWSHPLAETDLIVDLAGSVTNVAALGTPVADAFAQLYKGKEWRSVTMAGGCIPAMLTGFKIGATVLNRDELKLWRDIRSHSLPYQLDFGDYASVSPNASSDEIPGPVPINGKYTLQNQFIIFHGVKTKGPGNQPQETQLRSYAASITTNAGRGALPYCWGDSQFDEIAAHTRSASSPGGWIGFNVNRHIEVTRRWLP